MVRHDEYLYLNFFKNYMSSSRWKFLLLTHYSFISKRLSTNVSTIVNLVFLFYNSTIYLDHGHCIIFPLSSLLLQCVTAKAPCNSDSQSIADTSSHFQTCELEN